MRTAPSSSPARGESARQRPVILFIEDDLTQLDLYTTMINSEFDVIQATGAKIGYAVACKELPDAIVVDVLLPDGDGLLLCRWLRRNPITAGIPVVVITGDDAAYTRAQAVRSELTGILIKPCSADRLLAALREAIARVG
jgi:twitching motility two-component system response regulator PilH